MATTQARMRTEPIDKRGRPPFHWSRVEYGRRKPATYLVMSNHPRSDQRYCLGAITRTKGGYFAYVRGKNEFLSRPIAGVFPTRERASIALVVALNKTKYGRQRLDAARIHNWRTPR